MDKKSGEKEYYEREDLWDLSNFDQTHFKRVKMVLDSIPSDSTSLLDVGCGNGILCNQAQIENKNFTRVVGFDQSLEAMKQVRTEKKVGDIKNLPFKDNEFDIVCCLEVLEHISSEIFLEVLRELTRVAKKNIILTIPYNENLQEKQIQCPNCKTQFHRYLHVQSFNFKRLEELFDNYDFRHKTIKPIIKFPKKIGQKKFLKIFGLKAQDFFGDAKCPFCGYSKKKILKKSNKKDQGFKQFVDSVWPSKKEFIWFLAVYEKN